MLGTDLKWTLTWGLLLVVGGLAPAGCGGSDGAGPGAGDGGADTGADAVAPVDSAVGDGGSGDGATTDSAVADAGPVDAGDLPPTCVITAPLTGTVVNYDELITFVATANDTEDGPLSGASVVWRSSLAGAPLGTGLSITLLLPVPGNHVITCTATDSALNTGSGSIDVTSQSPIAQIFHPGDGEVRVAGTAYPLSGVGRDLEDGPLTGMSLVWTSSIDGMLGTGMSPGAVSASLSPGTNSITLTATDVDGNTGTHTITLTITP